MKRTLTTAATAGLAALLLAGCSSSDPAPAKTPGPAQMLADLDGDKRDPSSYQTVLDALTPKCKQPPKQLAAYANAVVGLLKKDGVNDETDYSALVHLNQSIPAGTTKMDCQGIAAAYVTMREGGSS
ncbi:hypothetical protein ACWC3Y_10900 [Streptomyces sp. NPDC001296]